MKQTINHKGYFSEKYSKYFLKLGISLHIAFLISLKTGFFNPLFTDSTHRYGQGADFFAVYQAGQNFVDGYSVYEKNPPNIVVPYYYPYRYLPFTAYTLGQFFRLFTPATAYIIWVLILEVLLLYNIYLTRKIFINQNQANVATMLWLCFSPYYLELYMGQFSFLMATLIFSMIYYWKIKRNALADILWIFSLLVKTNSVLFVPVLLKIKKRKTVLVALLFVLLFSVPYFLFVPKTIDHFLWNFIEGLSVETVAGNQGFSAFLAVSILRLGDYWIFNINHFFQNLENLNSTVRPPLLVWTIIIYLLTLLVTIRASKSLTTELFVLWILTYFLTYKHIWEHHYVMLIPVFILLYYRMVENKNLKVAPKKVFWWTFIISAIPTVFVFIDKTRVIIDPEFYWSNVESILYHAPKPLAVLVLYISIVYRMLKYGNKVYTR